MGHIASPKGELLIRNMQSRPYRIAAKPKGKTANNIQNHTKKTNANLDSDVKPTIKDINQIF